MKFAALVAVLAGSGVMMGCHKSPEERVEKISSRIASKLDFNEQQKALLKEITDELKQDVTQNQQLRRSRFSEIESIVMSTDIDQTKIKEFAKGHQNHMEAMTDKYIPKIAALHKTLSPEQKTKIVEKMQYFQQH